jgi:HSP20 family protein
MDGAFTPYELQETESEYVVKLDVPGMTEKDIKVSYQGDTLTVQGERKEEKTETKGATRYTECSYGSFLRTIAMPAPVKSDEIRARQKNGVMEIHLPKAQKSATRDIKIESGP